LTAFFKKNKFAALPRPRTAMASAPSNTPAVIAALAPLSAAERVAAAPRLIGGRVVFTTSFGLEDQAIIHMIRDIDIDVVTIDTGRLFPETYDTWDATERRYGRRIRAVAPDREAVEALVATQGINGFRGSVDARHTCCGVRKVVPLGRALTGADGWITGLRADQSQNRAATPVAAFDDTHKLIKINPLADWHRDDVVRYVSAHDIPHNPLHDRGFLSIGCAPCTRAVQPGEPERAGRWWWESEDKKECGLHLRPMPPAAPANAPRARTGTHS
jgi:phosphoadenosine phosphosulfate reductase